MAVFLISYDLRKPDFDYDFLYDALSEIGAKHVQDSVWGVNTDDSAATIFNNLWQHMHNERDRLFVVSFDSSADFKAINSMTKLKNL
jgi:CRISPR/Cas system-associated endoribonuclease Cas2